MRGFSPLTMPLEALFIGSGILLAAGVALAISLLFRV
jgi:hypothetical protein